MLKNAKNCCAPTIYYMKEVEAEEARYNMPVARLRPVDNKGQNEVFGNKKNKWGK